MFSLKFTLNQILLAVLFFTSFSFIQDIKAGDRLSIRKEKYQEFINLLGGMPKRDKIVVKELSVEKFPEYDRKLIQYVIMGDTVQAYVLIPKNIHKKVPGILAIHQDGSHRPYEFGKGEPAGVHGDTSLYYGLELCLNGNVVICPDRPGFESRMLKNTRYWKDYKTFPITLNYYGEKIDLTEDLYIGAKASNYLTQGKTLLGVTLIELMSAVDYLSSMEEVDNKKIGVIGHSAGGFLAGVLMYVDDRISAGVSSCGSFMISDIYNPDYLRPMNGFLGLLAIPGIKKWGDFDDVIAGIYPRYFLELSADVDRSKVFNKAFALQHNKEEMENDSSEVQDKIKCIFYNEGKHTFRRDMRDEAYRWLTNKLNKD